MILTLNQYGQCWYGTHLLVAPRTVGYYRKERLTSNARLFALGLYITENHDFVP
jgi:hypothetical protein